MKTEDFNMFRKLLRQRSGLVLGDEKAYLLESRLLPVARRHGLRGLEDVARKVRTEPSEAFFAEITEAMTTNESFFFRDVKPFDQFRDHVLPDLLASRADRKQIRIWCAAASSGQESYSLAMLLKEAEAQLTGWRTDIMATDISREILVRAREGTYSQFEVQRGLAIQLLVKYFSKEGEHWRISPHLRNMVRFQEFNLLDDFAPLGTFDVVFCRNVLIYFDLETKKQVLEKIARMLPPDGVVFLGSSETVLGLTDSLQPVPGLHGIYRLAGN